MDFRILGPLEVHADGAPLALGGGKQRALLALLVLHPNEMLSTDRLIDELWGEDPPPTAGKILQNYVSQLRRSLGDGRLQTLGRGYALRVAPGELDRDRFSQGLEEGRRARAAGDPRRASLVLREALGLWRGEPLSDFAYEPFARGEIERLEELRVSGLIERIDADLALGRHGELVGELEGLVARHPLQERLRAQLMLALYRSGRQAEALQVYQDARRTLVEELGIDPGQALQQLEKAILAQDPSLDPPLPKRTLVIAAPRAWSHPRAMIALVVLLATMGAVSTGIVLSRRGSAKPPTAVPANEVGAIDPSTNKLVAAIPVGDVPIRIAAAFGAVWALNAADHTVSRIDPSRMRVENTFPVTPGGVLTSLASGADGLWVADGYDGTIIDVYGSFGGALLSRYEQRNSRDYSDLAVVRGALWITSQVGRAVIVLDAATVRPVVRIRTAAVPLAITVGEGSVWLTGFNPTSKTGLLVRIDPTRKIVTATVPLPGIPGDVAVGYGAVWVTVNSQNAVWRIDPKTSSVVRTISVGDGPVATVVGAGSVWVVNVKAATLSRIDPTRNEVVATIRVGGSPRDVAVGSGRVWVAVS